MEGETIALEKELAANHAVTMVENGMKVGLGSGSTSAHMIKKLGERVQKGLSITAVASSEKSAILAQSMGIPLTTLELAGQLDINIDGADEFDTKLRLIKGGGGALLREKILAANANINVIIADSSKQVEKLGSYKLPLETIPFATANIISQLRNMGLSPKLRKVNGEPYRTDESNYIVDIDIATLQNIEALNMTLILIPGVVETGLFLNSTDILIMARRNKIIRFDAKEL